MPIITIEITPQGYARKAEIARVFTDELSRITGIPKEPIVVVFHETPVESIASAGEMLAEKFKRDQGK
ncbi:MAG: tautomerase family protein [Bacteroides sp.]|jgi:4-oxalocrotonate tautomerase family enzyme|nr:tautomerase family protein [Bacteroides sp.]